jgi:hypothetical protein
MMTPHQDLLDHAVDLFPAPEGSVAEVQRDVARRHRNRRLGAAAVVIAIWVAIGAAALAGRSDDAVPIQPPTPTPSPTVAPGTVDAQGWPTTSKNQKGVYSWDGQDHSAVINEGFMHNAMGGSGRISIWVFAGGSFGGTAGDIVPHEGVPSTIFGYEGSYLRYAGHLYLDSGAQASCEQWMVDIQGTTVTIKLCARPGAPADEIVEAHEIIESIRVESPYSASELGFRLVFTLTTNTWDSG